MEKIPVILDGFVAIGVALYEMNPKALDHTLVGHVSSKSAHYRFLEKIDKESLLDL